MNQPTPLLDAAPADPKNPAFRKQWLRQLLLLSTLAAIVVTPGCGASDEAFLEEDDFVAEAEEALIAGTNLALGKTATSSSIAYGADPSRAIDGNTNGLWAGGSIAHTLNDVNPWIQVDLQSPQFIGTVVLWGRTDCCSDQLSDLKVRVSDDQANWQDFTFAGAVVNQTTFAINRSARYVRVQLNGSTGRYMTLAELQVFGPPNLAQGKTATQSSTIAGGVPSRAVDGITSGNYGNGSVSHTNIEAQAWWQVDLGASHNVGVVELYNRTDCCAERLTNFKLLLSDDASTWTSINYAGQAPPVLPLTANRSARYVKVQLNGTNYLSLAEVRVYPMSNAAMVNTGAGSLPLANQPTMPFGELKGDFNVDAQGAATYSIPLDLPPGIRGVAPKLSLGYRSGGGNGMVGVGWSLSGLPTITRCPRTMAQDGVRGSVNGDANDRFCMDGQRLVAIAGTYGAAGTEYRTELTTYTRIRSYGSCGTGPCRFEVVDKTGNVASMGETNVVPTFSDNITPRSWSLKQMQDPNGNYYEVTHALNGDQLYPSSIQYTKHASAPSLKLRRVGFEYEARPDVEFVYVAGKKIATNQRLSAIKTYVTTAQGEELVRQYRLTYQTSGLTKRSLLDNVAECDALGVCLPETRFNYNSNAAGTQKFSWDGPNGAAPYDYQHRMRFDPGAFLVMGDVSGDGRSDFLRFEKGGWDNDEVGNFQSYTSTSGGAFIAQEYAGPFFNDWMRGDLIEIFPLDYNGDGRTDFIRREKGDWDNDAYLTFGVYAAKPTGGFDAIFPGTVSWEDPYQGKMSGDGGVNIITGDFNGDGRGDFLRQQRDDFSRNLPNSMFNVYFSTGYNGEFTVVTPQGNLFGATLDGRYVDLIPGDFNGDGKTDFLRRERDSGYAEYNHTVDVYYSLGDGTFSVYTPGQAAPNDIHQDLLRKNVMVYVPGSLGLTPGSCRIIPGDFNGDGKTDFIRQAAGSWSVVDPANTFSVYFSTGANGIFEKVTPTGNDYHGETFNGDSVEIIPFDYNGDGKTDFIRREFGSRADDAWYTFGVYVSRGNGTFDVFYPGVNGSTGDIYQGSSRADQALVHVGDFDGDGKSDFIRQEMGAAGEDDIGTFHVFLANGDDAGDFLKTVTTGIGNSVAITYGALNDPNVHTRATNDAPPAKQAIYGPMYVVKSTLVSEENAPTGEAYQYTYTGGLMNTEGRGFLGFASIKEVGPIVTRETLYHQDFPLTGSVKESRQMPNTGGPNKIVTLRDYGVVQTNPGVFAVLPVGESMTHTEPFAANSTSFTTGKAYIYDDYGNLTIMRDYGVYGDGRDDVDTCTTWLNNTSAWQLAYPTYTRVGDYCQIINGSCNCTGVKKWADRYYTGTNVTRLSEFDDANGTWQDTWFSYDVHGNMTMKTTPGLTPAGASMPLTIAEVTTYDPDYRTFPLAQSRVAAPLGLTTTFTYDPRFGTLAAQTDSNGNTVTNQFDGLGRLVIASATSPAGIVTPVMRILWGSGPKGKYRQTYQRNSWTADDWRWEREYVDGRGRTYRTESQSTTDGQPVVVNREFDAFGEVKKETVPFFDDNNTTTPDPTTGTTYTRDWMGRISQIVDPVGNTTQVSYAVNLITCDKCVVSETTIEGVGSTSPRTSLRYLDVDGNVLRQVNGDNRTTSFEYDNLGRRIRVTDAAGTTTQQYDSFGRIISSTSPDRGTTTNTYNGASGWLTQTTDGNGQVIQYAYDTLGRPITKTVVGKRTISFGYDDTAQTNALGRITSATVTTVGQSAPSSTNTFGYTPDGRISSNAITVGSTTYQVSSSYDPQGRLRSFTYPDGTVLDRTYNSQGLLSKLAIGTAEYARYENYTASGHPGKVTYANNTIREHSYDVAARLSTAKTTAGTTTLLDYAYTWDAFHRITGIQDRRDATRTQYFQYSAGGQLIYATGVYGPMTFGYDAAGNLTSKEGATFGYVGHRVVSGPNGYTATYDAAGNRTGQTRDSVAWTYEYDGENRLRRVVKNTNDEVNSFEYDALGERIKKVDDNLTTTYYITPNYEVTVLPDNRQIRTKYINDAAGRVASIVTDSGAQANLMFDLQTLDRMKDHYNTRSLAGLRAYAENRLQAAWMRPWVRSLAKTLLTFGLVSALGAVLRKVLSGRLARIQDKLRAWFAPPTTHYARRHPVFALATPLVMASFLAACQPSNVENVGYTEEALDQGGNGWGVPTAGTYFFHNNHLSSASVVTNLLGVEVARAEYKPYGEIVQSASPGTDMFRSKFTGKEWDRDSQLYDFHARAYDPYTGRFLTADSQLFGGPENAPTSLNPYAYANNNPIVYSDPSGHFFFLVIVVAVCVGAYAGGMSTNGTWNPAAWNWNSWTTYVGIAAGGAVGGATAGLGATVGGFGAVVFGAAIDSAVLNGLQFLSPRGYSLQDFGTDTAIGIATGAIMGKLTPIMKAKASALWSKITSSGAEKAAEAAATQATTTATKSLRAKLASHVLEASKDTGKGVWKVGTRIGRSEARANLSNPFFGDGSSPRASRAPISDRVDGSEVGDLTRSMVDALAGSTGADDVAGRRASDWRSSTQRYTSRSACRAPEAFGGFAVAF